MGVKIAPGLSMDTVRIPPLVVEVRHLVWKHRNHLQKCCRNVRVSLHVCPKHWLVKNIQAFGIQASTKTACSQKIYEKLDYRFLYLLHDLNLFRWALDHVLAHMYQNYSTDWNVHFLKTFSFLDTDGAKRSSDQIKEGTECRSAAYAVSSACCVTNEQVLKSLAGKREEHVGGELSIYLVNCLDYSYRLHSIHER